MTDSDHQETPWFFKKGTHILIKFVSKVLRVVGDENTSGAIMDKNVATLSNNAEFDV